MNIYGNTIKHVKTFISVFQNATLDPLNFSDERVLQSFASHSIALRCSQYKLSPQTLHLQTPHFTIRGNYHAFRIEIHYTHVH